MNDKVILITGATSGIGLETARQLAPTGATLVIVGRDSEKTAAKAAEIRRESGNERVDYLLADLSSMEQVRGLARDFRNGYDRLDVLINNVGAIFTSRQETADGYEKTFALNHLSYFLLTNLLLDMLIASAPARIINVSSGAHKGNRIDFDDLQMEQGYSAYRAYGRSKLMNILFTFELARRLAHTEVTVNALHPGFVASNFMRSNGGIWNALMSIVHLFALSPEEGAATGVYLATSPVVEGVTGEYFEKSQVATSSPASHDREAAQRLWAISAEMVGLAETEAALA